MFVDSDLKLVCGFTLVFAYKLRSNKELSEPRKRTVNCKSGEQIKNVAFFVFKMTAGISCGSQLCVSQRD